MSTAPTMVDVPAAVQAANRRFSDAFARGDGAAVAVLYTADAQLLPAHSDFVHGTAAIREFWQRVMDMGIREAMLETVEVDAQGETAIEVGRYTLKLAGGATADAGKYLVVWKRVGTAWQLHRDIWTTSRVTT